MSRRPRRSAGWPSDGRACRWAARPFASSPTSRRKEHIDGLPLGTRGGALVSHAFPINGEYEITIRLARDRNEHIEGLLEPHEVELLLDGERVRLFTIEPIALTQGTSSSDAPSHETLDSHLKVRHAGDAPGRTRSA